MLTSPEDEDELETSPEVDEELETSPEVEDELETSPEVEDELLTSPEVDELVDTSPEVEELLETSPDVEELLLTLQRARVGALLQVRTEPAVLGGDLLARCRVLPDDTGKIQQTQRRLEVDRVHQHRPEQ